MAYVAWDERMATGIRSIDTDHRTLVDIVNAMHDALHKNQGRRQVESTLDALSHYVDEHFTREEHFMEQAGYPGLEDHVRQHRKLSTAVHELRDHYHKDPDAVKPGEVLDLLKSWLVDHIMGADKEYIPYLTGEKQGEPRRDAHQRETRPVTVHLPPEDTDDAYRFARLLSEDGDAAKRLRKLIDAAGK